METGENNCGIKKITQQNAMGKYLMRTFQRNANDDNLLSFDDFSQQCRLFILIKNKSKSDLNVV